MSCQDSAKNLTGMRHLKSTLSRKELSVQLADDTDLAVPVAKHISGGGAPGHDAAEM